MVLGPTVVIPSSIIMQSFADYISDVEHRTIKAAHDSSTHLSSEVKLTLRSIILSRFGCRQVPTLSNLSNLIEQVARYEFCAKPAAAIVLIYSGILLNHKGFWEQMNASDV